MFMAFLPLALQALLFFVSDPLFHPLFRHLCGRRCVCASIEKFLGQVQAFSSSLPPPGKSRTPFVHFCSTEAVRLPLVLVF